jgi:DNA-binding beta-propeller fold protein YncE
MKNSSFLLLMIVAAAGLTANSDAFAQSSADGEPPLFYPPSPNPPRIQYLTKYSSAFDVSQGGSRKFRDFVFGGEESEDQILEKPYGVAIHKGAIYVIDTRGEGYVVFDVAAGKWRKVTGSGDGRMKKPINIAIDEDGTRYVTDTEREVVIVFNEDDRFMRTIGAPGQFRPSDAAISGDRLYVTDVMNHKVHVLNKYTGETLFAFGKSGNGEGEMVHPTNLAIAPDDTLYVSDTTNFRIQQFTLDGEYIRELGEVGTGAGNFARPKGVAIDNDGTLYVVDAAFQNVQVFDSRGRALMFFGGAGRARGKMNLPTVVKVDYDNVEYFQKYVADGFEIEYLILVVNQFGSNKVQVFGFGSETD